MKLVIATKGDLEHAGRLASWLSRPEVDQVIVKVPWLGIEERHRVARALETHFNDCGHTFGVPAFLSALAWCFYTGSWSSGATSLPAMAGYTVTVSALAALAGKLAGLAWSRRRLKALFKRISAAESESPRGAFARGPSRLEREPLGGSHGW